MSFSACFCRPAIGQAPRARQYTCVRVALALLVLLAACIWLQDTSRVRAQTLPNHIDVSVREQTLDAGAIPAIRFLTTPDFPPFNYRDADGKLVGYNIDLAEAVCDLLGVPCTMQTWPWEQVADALADRQGDALLAGLAITPENGERFDFSQIYMMLPGRFVTPLANAQAFTPSGLAGKPAAVRAGSAHETFLRRYLKDVQPVTFETEFAALDAVARGEVAAYFGDGLRASFWLNTHPDCCAFAGEAYFNPSLFGEGLAAAFPAGADPVRHAFNVALARLQKNGTLERLYLRWFPVSFY